MIARRRVGSWSSRSGPPPSRASRRTRSGLSSSPICGERAFEQRRTVGIVARDLPDQAPAVAEGRLARAAPAARAPPPARPPRGRRAWTRACPPPARGRPRARAAGRSGAPARPSPSASSALRVVRAPRPRRRAGRGRAAALATEYSTPLSRSPAARKWCASSAGSAPPAASSASATAAWRAARRAAPVCVVDRLPHERVHERVRARRPSSSTSPAARRPRARRAPSNAGRSSHRRHERVDRRRGR